jgi:uncharacterized membrane protein YeaQ/YmgE (transglycosylase-associated protein family)
MFLNIVVWILAGALMGWIAGILMKPETKMGVITNMGVGISGAFMVSFLMTLYGASHMTGFTRHGILIAIMGAGLLLFLVSLVRRAA